MRGEALWESYQKVSFKKVMAFALSLLLSVAGTFTHEVALQLARNEHSHGRELLINIDANCLRLIGQLTGGGGAPMDYTALANCACSNRALVLPILIGQFQQSQNLTDAQMHAIPFDIMFTCACANRQLMTDHIVGPIIAAALNNSVIPRAMLYPAIPILMSPAHLCSTQCKLAMTRFFEALPSLDPFFLSSVPMAGLPSEPSPGADLLGQIVLAHMVQSSEAAVNCMCQVDWTTVMSLLPEGALPAPPTGLPRPGESSDFSTTILPLIPGLLAAGNMCGDVCRPVLSKIVAITLHDLMYPGAQIDGNSGCLNPITLDGCVGNCASRAQCGSQCPHPQCSPPFSVDQVEPLVGTCLCDSGVDLLGEYASVLMLWASLNMPGADVTTYAQVAESHASTLRLCTAPACNALSTGLLQGLPYPPTYMCTHDSAQECISRCANYACTNSSVAHDGTDTTGRPCSEFCTPQCNFGLRRGGAAIPQFAFACDTVNHCAGRTAFPHQIRPGADVSFASDPEPTSLPPSHPPPPPPSPLPDEGIPVVPPPESAPSVSANKGMDIGPIAGGAGASLLLLAFLGLVWKRRQANRAQTANSQSGYQLREVTPEVVTGVVVAPPMVPYQKMSDM